MNPTLYIGGDLDKSKCAISAWDEKGKCLWEGGVKPKREGFQWFLNKFPGFRYKMALEATGFIWPVVDILQELGIDVSVANPMKNQLIGTSRKKTDLEDARKLANLLRTGYLPSIYIPTKEERELRNIAREKGSLVRHRTRLKSQTRSFLLQDGIQINKLWSKKGRAEVKRVDDERICRRLRILDVVDDEIEDAMKDINGKANIPEEAKILMSAPGIGKYAAMLILGEVCDIKRFKSSKKFTAYSGLVPGVRQTGSTIRMGPIRKDSNSWLTWIFIQCAWIAIRVDKKLRSFYLKKKKQKGSKKAIVAVARKMAAYIYWMLTKNVRYDVLIST